MSLVDPLYFYFHLVRILLQSHMLFSDGPGIETALEQKEKEPVAGTSSTNQAMDIDTPIRDDGFGGHLGQDIICKIRKQIALLRRAEPP